MGIAALDSESIDPEVFLALGLNESGKRFTGNPRMLSLLSSLLERSVQKNGKLLETAKKKDVVTIFHGVRAPNLSIQQYIDRIFKYSSCSPSCFVVAYIYIDRYLDRMDAHLTSLNVHRLLITGVMVAAKFIDDAFFNNAYYAKVGGVSTAEMNKLEINFLYCLDFRLQVTVETFKTYCLRLLKEAAGGYQTERPIQVCGLKENWPAKEESQHAPAITRFSCGAI